MKLYRYRNFIKESNDDLNKLALIKKELFNHKYGIVNYTINEDLSVDVNGSVSISKYYKVSKIPLKFRKVNGSFSCADNELTDLEGAPIEVNGDFYCYGNKLKNLKNSPISAGNFYCFDNNLTSLEGIPKKVKNIYCYNNRITDVKEIPDGWFGKLDIRYNPVHEIFKLFPHERWDQVVEHLNDYNVIRDGKVVILQALERVFWELDLEVPEIEEIFGYQIQF